MGCFWIPGELTAWAWLLVLHTPGWASPVEAVVDESGGEMHFTCTECGLQEDFYCDLCSYNFVAGHSGGDHRPDDEIPPGQDHIVVPERQDE
jgi:hypothetical protein